MEPEFLAALMVKELQVSDPALRELIFQTITDAHSISNSVAERAEIVVEGVIESFVAQGTFVKSRVIRQNSLAWVDRIHAAYLQAVSRASRPDFIY